MQLATVVTTLVCVTLKVNKSASFGHTTATHNTVTPQLQQVTLQCSHSICQAKRSQNKRHKTTKLPHHHTKCMVLC